MQVKELQLQLEQPRRKPRGSSSEVAPGLQPPERSVASGADNAGGRTPWLAEAQMSMQQATTEEPSLAAAEAAVDMESAEAAEKSEARSRLRRRHERRAGGTPGRGGGEKEQGEAAPTAATVA